MKNTADDRLEVGGANNGATNHREAIAAKEKALRFVTGVGVFSALAFLTTIVCQVLPKVGGFLSIDAKDAVIAISAFIYGPVAAPIISVIVSFLEFISFSETGIWGFVMNFTSSAVFSLTASLIYKFRKSFNGAVIGFALATVLTTVVMIGLNPLIIPLYTPVSREVVISMIPSLLLPFNFAKTLMNSAIAMLLYKPVINALRAAKLIRKSEHKTTFNRTSVITLIIGGTALLAALVIYIILMA